MRHVLNAILLVFLLIPLGGVRADVCADASYELKTQSEVNELGATGCDTVTGDLSVLDSPEIYNLEPLVVIDRVQGALTVSGNTALLNLDGLVNVEEAGSVLVESNTILTNVDGLGGLREVGDLTISSNPQLRDIEGLASLVVASGDVTLEGNPLIESVAGLESLRRIGGALLIEANDALVQIDALSNLKLVGTALTIKDNNALTSIQGLSGLIARTAVTVSGTASAGGSISPVSQQVLPGSFAQFTLTAEAGFFVSSVGGDCPSGSFDGATYTTGEITSNCTVLANFTTIPTFTVTASAGAGGSITPSSLNVEEGETGSFTITADDGYSFVSIGGSCPRGMLSATTYITGEIEADCTVTASFTANNPSGYCAGVPEGVICDPDADGRVNPGGTMDSWADKTWGFVNTPIPSGKTVAYPFLANAGAGGGEGYMEFSNNMPDLTATHYYWKGWFSETPGGAVLNDNDSYCRKYSANPNPLQMRWSQSSNPNRFSCDLGQAERVLYFNMGVECYEEPWVNPEDPRNCEITDVFPGIGGFDKYYIKIYPR